MIRTFIFLTFIITSVNAQKLPLGKEFWTSKEFVKSFNGSYRVNAEIEPNLSTAERGLLIQIQEKMKVGSRTSAQSTLKSHTLLKTSPVIQYNYANLARENGDLDTAITYYKKALETLPSFRRAHQNLGLAAYQSNDAETAEKHLLEAIKLGSQDPVINGILGYCYINKESHEAALLSFRNALRANPESDQWRMGIGSALASLGRSNEALKTFEEVAKKQPENLDIKLQIALIYLQKNNLKKAIPMLELLRRKGKLSTDHQILLGTLLITDGNFLVGSNALLETVEKEEFKKSVEIASALQAISFCIGYGQLETAEKLHTLIEKKPLSDAQKLRFKHLKAQLLFSGEPTSTEGIQLLEEIVQENPTEVNSLTLLGQKLTLTGHDQKALIKLSQAITVQPDALPALLSRAQLYVKMKRFDEAIKDLKGYLAVKEDGNIAEYLDAVIHTKKSYEL